MKPHLITSIALSTAFPLFADIKVDTTVPTLPPPPTKETITLNPALVDKLTKEIGNVVQLPAQPAQPKSSEQGPPPLSPLPAEQSGIPASAIPPAPPTPAPAATAIPAPTGSPAAPAAAMPAQPLTAAVPTGDALVEWYTAAEAYGTDAMAVRLIALLQSLNPQKPLAQNTDAYTAALNCHRLALSGNTTAMRQLAQAFETGTLAGLSFPQSLVASYFFSNRAQATLPDLTPAPAAP